MREICVILGGVVPQLWEVSDISCRSCINRPCVILTKSEFYQMHILSSSGSTKHFIAGMPPITDQARTSSNCNTPQEPIYLPVRWCEKCLECLSLAVAISPTHLRRPQKCNHRSPRLQDVNCEALFLPQVSQENRQKASE